MLESLSSSLQNVFRSLRGYGKLNEKNVKDALREVRMALLEADVHFRVAKDFTKQVRDRCLGQDVLESVTPGQQIVKRVHEEMTELFGGAHTDFNLEDRPAGVMLLGLHGSGKTTTAGKLAHYWMSSGKSVVLAACDIRRPAAVEQLSTLAKQEGAACVAPREGDTVPDVAARARREASEQQADIVIYDTGGRFQIDEDLVHELEEIREAVQPADTVLVLDAAIGQESVEVARRFHEAVGLTGLILTKLDGDARGGAALSVHSMTGCPILMTGTGERPEDLEPFYPERMASRILGMGDVVSLVEKAQQNIDEDDARRMQEKLAKNTFDLQDFHDQMQQMKKMGPMENILKMLPGAGELPEQVKSQLGGAGDNMKRQEAIIRSMTPKERHKPSIINASRRRRIARGSGVRMSEVNELLKNFDRTRKMTRQMKKMRKRLPGIPNFPT
ncbi:signal recognition particle protein [Kiritimatiella glycovorans]|uniref:Signal recognition particle protein n=1 Tax=Kiritimatiella glycovorans TaxID=1307763 RepID=A0A0G3EAU7_9BACT|nr:signal recognition particle protein [Kiritimatiella glycovorans]AKJ63388.1 hypothetical protein L21SP4_00102 [Kiritimatiella glycovorans]